MRWGRLGHQLRQLQPGMKTIVMAMHDNVGPTIDAGEATPESR